ncbi:MAG: hypothetical protein DLD55_01755 [candidate division SR1 bacterium]|nr:MAG: hypothetical protein DLD55_01755 [candidate division SR1 bacterium]
MLPIGPNWQKLYDEGKCLYYGVPFNDEQMEELDAATSQLKREALIRKWRKEYQNQQAGSSEEIEDENNRIEELKRQILELDPKAVFRNPSIKSLEERLKRLGGGEEDETKDSPQDTTAQDEEVD